jgi:hypothetical protein
MSTRTRPLFRLVPAAFVALLAVTMLAACGGSGAKQAAPPQSSVDNDGAGDSLASDDGTESSSGPASTLPDDACAPSEQQLAVLSPQAPLHSSALGGPATQRIADADVRFDQPFFLDFGNTGTMVICRFATGEGNSSNDARVTIHVVDFTGGVNEDPGPDIAKEALSKLRGGYADLQGTAANTSTAPDSVSGVGEEAFHASFADDLQQALVARKGKVLIMVAASNGSVDNDAPQIAFAQLPTIAGDLLDAAVDAAGSSGPTPTTVKTNSDNSVVTKGALDGTWLIRDEDVDGAALCGPPVHVDIPIKSSDGTLVAHLAVGVGGDEKAVELGSSKLEDLAITGNGGFDLEFSGDSLHPKATLKIDTTLHGSNGTPDTSIKGQLSFTCP